MPWRPDLSRESGALPERILAALRRDIASGALPAGTRLPPQRNLAFDIGVSLGVVSRAYTEAERLGLTRGEVGRGTFIQGDTPPPGAFTLTSTTDDLIDLARNYPPLEAAKARMPAALEALARSDMEILSTYGRVMGWDQHRQVAARWIRTSTGYEVDWTCLLPTVGAQQAIDIALRTLLAPGDALMCEAATFHGAQLSAAQNRLKLVGLPMDAQGVTPEGLDAADAKGARVAYLMPTLQNPSGRTMSFERRTAIIEVARRRDLILIEDDIYAPYAGDKLGDAPTPLASLAPERVYYLTGASKILSPGLRLGFLVAPDETGFKALTQVLRASLYSPPALGAALFAHWVETGDAEWIARENRRTARVRMEMALKVLGNWAERPSSPQSLHLWLPMDEARAERVASRALRGRVEVTPPSALVVDPTAIMGLRVCLGQAADGRLETGLRTVAGALAGAPDPALEAVA